MTSFLTRVQKIISREFNKPNPQTWDQFMQMVSDPELIVDRHFLAVFEGFKQKGDSMQFMTGMAVAQDKGVYVFAKVRERGDVNVHITEGVNFVSEWQSKSDDTTFRGTNFSGFHSGGPLKVVKECLSDISKQKGYQNIGLRACRAYQKDAEIFQQGQNAFDRFLHEKVRRLTGVEL